MHTLRDELRTLATALMFFTILPLPAYQYRPELLQRMLRYSAAAGWVIGAIGALVFLLSVQLWPLHVATGLALLATAFATGCLHEDGFADFCDGLRAQGNHEAKLAVMRDSRIGLAGRVGAVSMLLARLLALWLIGDALLIAASVVIGHSLGRFASAFLVFDLYYARKAGPGNASALASGRKPTVTGMTPLDTLLAGGMGLVTLLLLPELHFFWLIAPLVAAYLALRLLLLRVFGGYTGDSLGAAQQLFELTVYCSVAVIAIACASAGA